MRPEVRAQAIADSGGYCGGCQGVLRQVEVHHRQAKKMGGPGKKGSLDYPENLVALCPQCHRLAHANPIWARSRGLIVPSWQDPRTVPIVPVGWAV